MINPFWMVLFLTYQLSFPLLAVGILLRFLTEGRGARLAEGPQQLRQRLGLLNSEELRKLSPGHEGTSNEPIPANRGVLWIHAASVGEVNAAAPLLKAIRSLRDSPKILMTASTAAGRERAGALPEVDLAVLAPIDFYPSVQAFLRRVRPFGLILVETELWPAALYLARRWNLKIVIVNGRLTERAFERYRWIRFFMEPLLDRINLAALQTKEDADRFAALGISEKSIRVVGNLKHDIHAPDETATREARQLIGRLGWKNDPIFVAGSTRPDGEEEIILSAFHSARKRHPNLRLVLAPRHIERCHDAAELLRKKGISFAALSSLDGGGAASSPFSPPPDCLLLDRIGMLPALYALGTVAFVGGTLVPVGGHNVLEPAIAGRPVLFGPHTKSVSEAARLLESAQGGFRVHNAAELARMLDQFLSYPTLLQETARHARETAERLSGATRRTMEFIKSFLDHP